MFSTIGISRLRILNDGDGVTSLAAGYGCPLRCKYCLNPQCFIGQPLKQYTVRELIDELKIDDLYFQATGGGVVFGGGEPLLQADFIRRFCRECPPEWIISLETSLAVPTEELKKVEDYISFYLVDIKDMNPEIYKKYTGIGNERLISNLNYLKEQSLTSKVCIRLPLIPGYNNDSDRDLSQKMLEKMGFDRFDRFNYKTELPMKKRQAAERRTESRTKLKSH